MSKEGFLNASYTGLSDDDVKKRLEVHGYNELPSEGKKPFYRIFFEVMKEPMFLILVACGVLYFVFGEITDALLLLVFVWLVIGLTIYQERKVERALEALRNLSSPRALVIRSGQQKMIPGREVVLDDLVILSEGDRVPADCAILTSSNLMADESILTGESESVRKIEWDRKFEHCRAGGNDLPFIYSGTLIVQGHCIAQVIKIGEETEMGKIGKSLKEIEPEKTVLQKETAGVIKIFGFAALIVCILIVFFYWLSTNNFTEGLLVGLSVGMSVIPEEFAVVLTVFLALGAWRMSRRKTLTRRLNAIQSVGAATVLCVDKTGTITLNRMTLKVLFSGKERMNLSEMKNHRLSKELHNLLEFSALASQKLPFDPMERAIKETYHKEIPESKRIKGIDLIKEYNLSSKLLAMSHVWKHHVHSSEYIIASKGAPESIAELCHLSEKEKNAILSRVEELSNEGYRVLAVARAKYFHKKQLGEEDREIFPEKQHDFDFEFMGLLGLEDPVRPSVQNALQECYSSGIKVIMITGDYAGTAMHVAKKAGFSSYSKVITGPELAEMSDEVLRERIKEVTIFARIAPEQKLRIVNALKHNKEVVVMTGDGVNDAPALKAADVGIAMGARGSEVAREAASLVLLDDDFSSIVEAVKMGRRIFDNIRKAMTYIIAIHIPIAGIALIPVLLNWPLILFPVHIAFLELIIDPICAIAFEAEPEEKDIMKRKPKKANEPLFDKPTLVIGIAQGVIVLVVVLFVFMFVLFNAQSDIDARAIAFTTLIIANLFVIFSMRSKTRTVIETLETPNPSLWIVTIAALLILGVVIFVPFLRDIFHFSELHLLDIAFSIVAGLATIMLFEVLKVYNKIVAGGQKASG